ncbi:MAG TPA: hypothetical protein VEB42_13355 [Chitinophagaceae bacterium]|nr:hypothetical protein [Chitinophagaceae bacterium]
MQRDNDQSQRSESEELQRQDPNPGSLAVSDEQQRTKGREPGNEQQQMPTGNEQNSQDTQGTVAGVGE